MVARCGVSTMMAAVALMLTSVAGCASEEQGVAEPANSSNGTSSEINKTTPTRASTISSSIDPCELISANDLAEVGKFESEHKEGGGARSCYWQNSFEDGGDGFTFAVSVRDSQGIETVNDNGGGIQSTEVNQRPAVSTEDPKFGDCTFAMKIDDSSRVDITVTDEGACEIAEVIAGMVEPRLPELP